MLHPITAYWAFLGVRCSVLNVVSVWISLVMSYSITVIICVTEMLMAMAILFELQI